MGKGGLRPEKTVKKEQPRVRLLIRKDVEDDDDDEDADDCAYSVGR
jgi:hypothetical protein